MGIYPYRSGSGFLKVKYLWVGSRSTRELTHGVSYNISRSLISADSSLESLSTSINHGGNFSPSFSFGGDMFNLVKHIHSKSLHHFMLIFYSQAWASICQPIIRSFKMHLRLILYPYLYCTNSFNLSVMHHRPPKINEKL